MGLCERNLRWSSTTRCLSSRCSLRSSFLGRKWASSHLFADVCRFAGRESVLQCFWMLPERSPGSMFSLCSLMRPDSKFTPFHSVRISTFFECHPFEIRRKALAGELGRFYRLRAAWSVGKFSVQCSAFAKPAARFVSSHSYLVPSCSILFLLLCWRHTNS